jgi:flavin reductase (DIM6/NTAB) family NADH-FMN oxidoreductase RutF
MPVTIIASEYGGRVNFAPAGQCASLSAYEPPLVCVSIIKEHFTAKAIAETGLFSMNIPGVGQLGAMLQSAETSGNETDKSELFNVFYGEAGIPLISECPVCFSCRVRQSVDLGELTLFIAAVTETYAGEGCLNGEACLPGHVDPLLCSMDGRFWRAVEINQG